MNMIDEFYCYVSWLKVPYNGNVMEDQILPDKVFIIATVWFRALIKPIGTSV